MLVRVVNTYIPAGSAAGAPIEIWAGSPDNGGRKLTTVEYGTVSAYFAPEVPDPLGQGVTDPRSSYTLNFYPVGAKVSDDLLIGQGENASPGQKLTMIVAPNDSNARGASVQVFADDIGSSPQASGFPHVDFAPAPSGKAVLKMDALALQNRPGMTNSSSGLTPSTPDGQCLPYFDVDTTSSSPTYKLHDMSSDTMDLFGGTEALDYVVPPGTPIRVNQLKDQQSAADACKDKPVLGPVDPKLAAGQRAYGIMYGPTLATSRVLFVPVG